MYNGNRCNLILLLIYFFAWEVVIFYKNINKKKFKKIKINKI